MKAILGGGISGLIYHRFHPEYKIISPDIGGLLRNEFTFLLHDTIPTRMLLEDLRLPIKSYEVKIGFYHNGLISNYQNPDLAKSIVAKKMTNWNVSPDYDVLKDRTISFDYVHSGNISTMLEIDTKELIHRLTPNYENIIEGSVILLTPKFISYTDSGEEKTSDYDSIVSTIPAPIFFEKIFNRELGLRFSYIPVTYCVVDKCPSCFNDNYHLIYYDNSKSFTRVTKTNNKYAIEFTGMISRETAQQFIEEPIQKVFTIPFGRIVNKVDLPKWDKVKFLGRFSEWKWGLTTEHIIKQSLEF